MLADQEKFQEADELFRQAIEVDPERATVYVHRGEPPEKPLRPRRPAPRAVRAAAALRIYGRKIAQTANDPWNFGKETGEIFSDPLV